MRALFLRWLGPTRLTAPERRVKFVGLNGVPMMSLWITRVRPILDLMARVAGSSGLGPTKTISQ
jgi:hypothetical protein